ncbi:MAG: 2-iminoacetate synthase ThiH [Fibrobacterota bacterium]
MKSSFYDYKQRFDPGALKPHLASVTPDKVERALSKSDPGILDFLTLLSDSADAFLEPMAQKARILTKRQFGNSVFIFTPLYLSDYCVNTCPYCSFAGTLNIERTHLSLAEAEKAAARISQSGIRHILILTGEAPERATLGYLIQSTSLLKNHFSSIGLETYPQTEGAYSRLLDAGADSLTIYQEVYAESAYSRYHESGPKADYRFRLEAPDRALSAGMRAATVGALLGLHDIIEETFYTALHLQYLQETYPWAEINVSLPRIRPVVSGFTPPYPVSDKLFVKILLALRIFKSTVGITISTRESGEFRDALLPLGVTKMSAGVSTAVGGHSREAGVGQFEIADTRSVEEVCADLLRLGVQPVMQDWNHRMMG